MADSQPSLPPSQTADATATSTSNEAALDNDAEVQNALEPATQTSVDSTNAGESESQAVETQTQQQLSSTDPDGTATSSGPANVAQSSSSTAANMSSQPQAGMAATDGVEARIPQKKDATLREFLSRMDAHAPIIPDAVTNHYLTLAGLPPPPQTSPHLARLLALATQKFVADVAADAYQYARIRSSHTTSNTANALMATGQAPMPGMPGGPAAAAAAGPGAAGAAGKAGDKGPALGMQRPGYGGGGQGGQQGRTVLTMEDLGMAVGEYGVNVKRGEFYR